MRQLELDIYEKNSAYDAFLVMDVCVVLLFLIGQLLLYIYEKGESVYYAFSVIDV
jgi:hypothetical protein